MLNALKIHRHFAARRFARMLDEVARNGFYLPVGVQEKLLLDPAGCVAVGLQRTCQLSYGRPGEADREMVRFLLDRQQATGTWGGDPLLTAAAVAALRAVHHQLASDDPLGEPIHQAASHGIMGLTRMQQGDGLFSPLTPTAAGGGADEGEAVARCRGEQDRALTGAYILWVLAEDEAFRRSVRFGDLVGHLQEHAPRLRADAATLFQLARGGATAVAA